MPVELDAQILFNLIILLASGLGGWILKSIRDSIAELYKQDKEIMEKVQGIEVLVAGDYVKKADMTEIRNEVMTMLRRIEQKLDQKADK